MKIRLILLMAALASIVMLASCDSNGEADLYNITIEHDSANGTVAAQFDKATAGTAVNIAAEPAENKRFVRWEFSSDVVIFGATTPVDEIFLNPVKFNMPAADLTITPVFGEPRYRVIMNEPQGGTVIGSATATPSEEILPGETVTITANVANGDYMFASWEINSGNLETVPVENPGTFIMPEGDVTITPVILPKSTFYKVTIGSDDPVAQGQFDHVVAADYLSERALVDGVQVGTIVSYTAYAKAGFEVFQWSVWNDFEGRSFSGNTVTFEVSHTSNHLAIPWIREIETP